MPAAIKKTESEKKQGNAVVSPKVKSYADDPYFVKKANEAKETIKKVGLPNQK
jgi:hypothetical protein